MRENSEISEGEKIFVLFCSCVNKTKMYGRKEKRKKKKISKDCFGVFFLFVCEATVSPHNEKRKGERKSNEKKKLPVDGYVDLHKSKKGGVEQVTD